MLDKSRIGFYSWGGPGTVRMLGVKYFRPKIDMASLMQAYDYDHLARVQEVFRITDIWVTYSWGFSPLTEQEDYDFVVSKLEGMKKLGLTVHAYLQGPNLVYKDFPDKDWWCVDEYGRLISCYKGRKAVNLLHPEFREYKLGQIRDVAKHGFDGVFIDNIQVGQLGIPLYVPGLKPFVFIGSADEITKRSFSEAFGRDIPTDLESLNNQDYEEYLNFRSGIATEFLREMGQEAHRHGLQLGSNSFDPRMDIKYITGVDLQAIAPLQDYLLFENHSLPTLDGSASNKYIDDLMTDKGIENAFVISYRRGIGAEPSFSQTDYDLHYAEHYAYRFNIALKGSEFTTKGVWHNLRPEHYRQPNPVEALPNPLPKQFKDGLEAWLERNRWLRRRLKHHFNPLVTFFMESAIGRFLFKFVYYLGLH